MHLPGVVFLLWITVFLRSIPAFIDGSMFKAPYVIDGPAAKEIPTFDIEKNEQQPAQRSSSTLNEQQMDKMADERPL